MMKLLIDGDGCPVIREAEKAASLYSIPSIIFCDTSHQISSDISEVVVVEEGNDSADFILMKRVAEGDVVITQDYGLASLVLAKGAYAFHQNGWQYTKWNIDRLLMERYEGKKARRRSKNHLKGPAKRKKEDNENFFHSFCRFLEKSH